MYGNGADDLSILPLWLESLLVREREDEVVTVRKRLLFIFLCSTPQHCFPDEILRNEKHTECANESSSSGRRLKDRLVSLKEESKHRISYNSWCWQIPFLATAESRSVTSRCISTTHIEKRFRYFLVVTVMWRYPNRGWGWGCVRCG